MSAFVLIFLTIIAVVALFLYYYVKRVLGTFGICIKLRRYRFIIAAAIFGLSCFMFWLSSFSLIVILHFAAFMLVCAALNAVVRKAAGKRYTDGFGFWKKLHGIGVFPLILTAVMMIYGYINMNSVVGTYYTVHTDKNIPDEGYRVAFIADVHFGVSLDGDELRAKCDEIEKTNPDMVILGGDIVDNSTAREDLRLLFDALGSIESTYGVYYTYGNHDRPMRMMSGDFTGDDLAGIIRDCGITILEDDVVSLTDDFTLVGRADKSSRQRKSVKELLSGADHEGFILTVDHQPNEYAENGEAGTDLLLSGHTHAGQLFPVNYLMEIIPFNDAVYGYYDIDDDTKAIVTSGFAAWSYPVKTASPSEYVVVDIKPE